MYCIDLCLYILVLFSQKIFFWLYTCNICWRASCYIFKSANVIWFFNNKKSFTLKKKVIVLLFENTFSYFWFRVKDIIERKLLLQDGIKSCSHTCDYYFKLGIIYLDFYADVIFRENVVFKCTSLKKRNSILYRFSYYAYLKMHLSSICKYS